MLSLAINPACKQESRRHACESRMERDRSVRIHTWLGSRTQAGRSLESLNPLKIMASEVIEEPFVFWGFFYSVNPPSLAMEAARKMCDCKSTHYSRSFSVNCEPSSLNSQTIMSLGRMKWTKQPLQQQQKRKKRLASVSGERHLQVFCNYCWQW